MKILLIHPGHTFSTSDVYDGLLWGLRWAGAEVLEYRWDKHMRTMERIILAGIANGQVVEEHADLLRRSFAGLAAADAFTLAAIEQVDAALVVNGLLFPPERASLLRRLGIPVACYGTEAPYAEAMERAIAGAYSHWFTQERASVARMADLVPCTYLPLAYHPERHQPGPVDPEKAAVDAVFVGGGYPERQALLNGVDWAAAGPGRRAVHARVGTLWDVDLAAEAARGLSPGKNPVYSQGSIPNEETAAWHRSAAVALNAHRRMTYVETLDAIPDGLAESCNPRIYEVPAVGGFLLTDARPEVHEVLGDAAATYRAWDSADLTRQLRYWLTYPDRREAAAAAQRQAIADHHYGTRARTVLETLIA